MKELLETWKNLPPKQKVIFVFCSAFLLLFNTAINVTIIVSVLKSVLCE
jgi:hypothetical protein